MTSLSREEIKRYGRHLILPQVGVTGQERLKQARVLLVGTGGLGSPLGLYLAAAGVGTLGLADGDQVDISNLQRQVLFSDADVGRSKTEAAMERLQGVNPHVRFRQHGRIEAENVLEILDEYDVVVDGSDNFPTRYLINDACVLTGKPDVWGAVLRFEGQVAVFWSPQGPCYRCLFPAPPPAGLVPSCAEGGVFGVLPGIIGTLQASETLKLLLEEGEPLIGRFVIFDALRFRFREIRLEKSEDCPICRERPPEGAPRRELQARLRPYEDYCSTSDAPQPTEEDATLTLNSKDLPFEVTVQRLKSWIDSEEALTVLDVREPQEHEICHIKGSVLLPLRELPQRMKELDRDRLTVVHCHHGARSAQAVAYLRQQGFSRVTNLQGGIDAWSLEIDPSQPRY